MSALESVRNPWIIWYICRANEKLHNHHINTCFCNANVVGSEWFRGQPQIIAEDKIWGGEVRSTIRIGTYDGGGAKRIVLFETGNGHS